MKIAMWGKDPINKPGERGTSGSTHGRNAGIEQKGCVLSMRTKFMLHGVTKSCKHVWESMRQHAQVE